MVGSPPLAGCSGLIAARGRTVVPAVLELSRLAPGVGAVQRRLDQAVVRAGRMGELERRESGVAVGGGGCFCKGLPPTPLPLPAFGG